MPRLRRLRRELIVAALLCVTAAPKAQPVDRDDVGVSGQVLGPDGIHISGGTVVMIPSLSDRVSAPIDRDGRFRVIPTSPASIECSSAAPIMRRIDSSSMSRHREP
jgi:hypothetical protein